MYLTENYRSKAAAKRALAAGDDVYVMPNSEFDDTRAGDKSIEGPHAPAMHTWYGTATIIDGGKVVAIR